MGGSPTISWFPQRVVIGVGDLAVSNAGHAILSTYALGSCVGLAAFDPVLKVGGILHFMLPESRISPDKAAARPAMFADTGLRLFFRQWAAFGVKPGRLQLFLAGGAKVLQGNDPFRIGVRNAEAALGFLAAQGLRVGASDLGGSFNRTMHLALGTGRLTLKSPHSETEFNLDSDSPGLTAPPGNR